MTPKNAEKIIDLISGDNLIYCQNSDSIKNKYFNTHSYLLELFRNNLEKLKTRLIEKDDKALDLLFYWNYHMCSGVYSEEISSFIGSTMNIDMSYFLYGLTRNMKLVDGLGSFVLMDIYENFYVPEKRCAEYEKIIKSLERINDSRIEKVKNDVLSILIKAKQEECVGF
ncbi:MAG: hypothetical protein ACFFBU_09490 [Promethearchaeota archaeon]